jgi:hypothetical protein
MGFDDSVEAVLARIPPPATHFLFHLNVSITTGLPSCRDDLIAALAARGIKTINAGVTDISKPFIQKICADHSLNVCLAPRTVPDDTMVIAKSSLNHGGKTERDLPPAEVTRLGLHLPPRMLGPANYRVVRAGDVPAAVWEDSSLFIERFISNDEGRYHRAYLCADRLVVWEGINPNPIKKTFGDVSSRTSRFRLVGGRYLPVSQSDQAPQALLADLAVLVAAFGFSFGTIDAMSDDDGQFYFVDVNTTPFYRSSATDIAEHLGGASIG